MNKIWMGICVVIAATGVGVGVAQHVQPGGAVHKSIDSDHAP
ncbi:hypothetical protein SAMN05192583_0941 [Sphingomonas gellani]|uniref:Uncharacterized protein n=1 Tax=Sphingomonas gellani TaxID=1166340 RepID=A0A1H8AK19_9SPHN|nr:hypothetical protein [Sphingomonas gellani]SEM70836.1 hypothetical protein SAMN05192583_0941 [Sphingomonas gellani]